MIPRYEVEKVLEANPIEQVVRSIVKLDRKGANLIGLCPFHNEKTPSFMVSPARNRYKCWGCGASGDAITFLMEYNKMSYIEAVKDLANRAGIALSEYDDLSPEQKKVLETEDRIIEAYKLATQFYHDNLIGETEYSSVEALNYANARMSEETIALHKIGYSKSGLKAFLNTKGFGNDLLVTAGLVSKSDKDYKDKFYNRLMFPICNSKGDVVAFTGRKLNNDEPKLAKYINTCETPIYHKSQILYNYNFAKRTIHSNEFAYLVEGNMDVIGLQEIEIENVVAQSGTALSSKQIDLLERVCKSVKIIEDTDDAGIKALNTNAKALIQRGFSVTVVSLPEEYECERNEKGEALNINGEIFNIEDGIPLKNVTRVKFDADSFFRKKENKFFHEYVNENSQDYIHFFADTELFNEKKELSKAKKSNLIKEVLNLILNYDKIIAHQYLSELKKKDKETKWNDIFQDLSKEKIAKEAESKQKEEYTDNEKNEKYFDDSEEQRDYLKTKLPNGVDLDFYREYGFYSYKDELYYYFSKNKKELFYRLSNFTIASIAHIMGETPKRILSVKNCYGKEIVVELEQDALVSVNSFKKEIEGKGNFIYEGDQIFLDKIKHYLYKETITCSEIDQIGWQRGKDFWAYSNGVVVNGEFVPVDQFGLVKVFDNYYYIPAFSIINKDKEQMNTELKKLVHIEREDKMTYRDFAEKFIAFYGDNAKILICCLFGIMFKDIIKNHEMKLPILYAYGIRSSGKTTFAKQFMGIFQQNCLEINLGNVSLPALGIQIDAICNLPILIDEFQNDIDPKKIEYLKSCFDGSGRMKANMDDIKKTTTTRAHSAILMCGQQQIQNPALLSRCCVMNFFSTKHSVEEQQKNKAFSELMAEGHTHIINEFLKLRPVFDSNFKDAYSKAMSDIAGIYKKFETIRVIECWAFPLACYAAVQDHIDIPITYDDMLNICVSKAIEQDAVNKNSSEIFIFWDSVISNISTGRLRYGYDFIIASSKEISTDKKESIPFEEDTLILYINTAKVFDLYVETASKGKESFIPRKSMVSYLENCTAFLGTKKSKKFKLDQKIGDKIIPGYTNTRSMVFNYQELDIDLISEEQKKYILEKRTLEEIITLKPIENEEDELTFDD